jgi:hypothetical protein
MWTGRLSSSNSPSPERTGHHHHHGEPGSVALPAGKPPAAVNSQGGVPGSGGDSGPGAGSPETSAIFPEIPSSQGNDPEPGGVSGSGAGLGSKKPRSAISINIRGLNNNCDKTKTNQLGDLAVAENAVVIAVTETWLNKDHEDAEVSISGFNLFRADREDRGRGGVCIYVREDLVAVPILKYSNGYVEALALKIRDLEWIIFCVYHPPKSKTSDFEPMLRGLDEAIEHAQAHSLKYSNILGLGHFNLPETKWRDIQPDSADGTRSGMASLLLKFMDDQFLTQLVKDPTCGHNILDLVLSNNVEQVSHIEVRPTVKLSDHSLVISFLTSFDSGSRKEEPALTSIYSSTIPRFDTTKGDSEDWLRFRKILESSDWAEESSGLSLNEKILLLTQKLEASVAMVFPVRKSKQPGNCIPLKMRKLMVKRTKLSRRLLRTRSAESVVMIRQELEVLEIQIAESHSSKRRKDEAKVTAVLKENPAEFYKYAARFSKTTSKIGPLKVEHDSHTSDESTMSELLASQYKSVFSVPRNTMTEELIEETFSVDPLGEEPLLTSITFTIENVEKALNSLSGSASPGPDGIPALCLKRGGSLVLSALVDVFTTSMNTGLVDNSMRMAFITPIWKGGDRSLTINYRPVSLSSHMSKTMERVMRTPIVEHLEATGQIDQSQHGARAGRSTLSQLLVHYDAVLKLIEEGGNCEQLYLDFSKAFDKVDHSLLIRKLAAMGIRGKLGTWLGRFLLKRTQAVRVGSRISSWTQVTSGVPQGTVLGPLFFLCFIADLGGDLAMGSSMILKFVDDTKLIKGVSSPDDIEALQDDLEKLYQWQEANNMEWNGSKFQALRMGSDRTLREESMLFTPNHDDPIEELDVVKDLGVLMDSLGTFGPQRAKANAKAKQKAGWILRTFRSRDLPTMRTLWNTLVRPHQDYCSQLWSPVGLTGDLLEQESSLRSFTRRIRGFSSLNYWERLAAACLYSSERRQERYKILYAYKSIRGFVPDCGLKIDTAPESRRGRTIAIPLISAPRSHMAVKTLRDKSFQSEAPKLFNALPAHLRNLDTTTDTFKAHLDSYLESIPDQPATPGLVPAASNQSGRPSNSIRDWARRLQSSS